MKRRQQLFSAFMALLVVSGIAITGRVARAQTSLNYPKVVAFQPVFDPWTAAQERWWDISNHSSRQFNGFLNGSQQFNYYGNYNSAQITQATLTYDQAPGVPYFVGRVQAQGLKPNFAYQIKLMGKPEKGPGGWGASGSDASNKAIGSVGRWFCNSAHDAGTNFNDEHYKTFYEDAPDEAKHDINGYLFCGVFVTDKFGNANVNFTSQNNYHITFQSWQLTTTQRSTYPLAGTWNVQGGLINSLPTTYYGYGSRATSQTVTLYYQWEDQNSGQSTPRPHQVVLPNGTYRCRLVLTEETFHNNPDTGNYGGRWKTVLGTEDVGDTEIANDVVFTIGAGSVAPFTPTGLSATTSNAKVSLAWNASIGATGYTVKRSLTSEGPFEPIGSATTPGYVDTTVSNDTTYYYVVSASNGAGVSPDSAPVAATPVLPPAPLAPGNVSAVAVSSTRIDVAWSDVADETAYIIQRSTGGGAFAQIATPGSNVTSYSDTSVIAATTYTYRLRAVNDGVSSPYSLEAVATTPPTPRPPAAPGGLTATVISSKQINLKWTDNSSNETGFKIQRSTNGSSYSVIATVGANVSSYSNTGLTRNTTYYYRVVSTNTVGDSAPSAAVSARTSAK